MCEIRAYVGFSCFLAGNIILEPPINAFWIFSVALKDEKFVVLGVSPGLVNTATAPRRLSFAVLRASLQSRAAY